MRLVTYSSAGSGSRLGVEAAGGTIHDLTAVLFGITVALQRKRIAYRFAIGIALLPVPILAGLPPILLDMPPVAANGWYTLTVPIGLLISLGLLVGLLREPSRAWFSEP